MNYETLVFRHCEPVLRRGNPELAARNQTAKQADIILYSLFINLNELLGALWQSKYKRYKYIDSLPASPYKSVQMILAEMEESCGERYKNRFAGRSQ